MTLAPSPVRAELRSERVEDRPAGRNAGAVRQAQGERKEDASKLFIANLLALLVPAALLAGAWGFQLIGGYTPCQMCHWQRWPHYAAILVAAIAFTARGTPGAARTARVALIALAALLIAGSGAIGVAHAGVEYHWWRGFTACTAPAVITGTTAAERLASLLAQPLVRCDAPAWTLGGVSMAGFNALFSLGGAAAIGFLLTRRTR